MLIYDLLDELLFKMDYENINKHLLENDNFILKTRRGTIKKTEVDYSKFGKYGDYIKEFVQIFENNFSEKQTENMKKNLAKLKIVEESYNNKFSLGKYNEKENKIVLNISTLEDDETIIKNTLFHELLHMSSLNKRNNKYYCGFYVCDYFGDGLNEGCTNYILEKYFLDTSYTNNKTIIVKNIDELLEEGMLENFYFNADISGLVKELQKIYDRKTVIKLIYEMDRVDDIFTGNKMYIRLMQLLNEHKKKKEKKNISEYVMILKRRIKK